MTDDGRRTADDSPEKSEDGLKRTRLRPKGYAMARAGLPADLSGVALAKTG